MAKNYVVRISLMAFALMIFNFSSSALTVPSTEPVSPKSENTLANPFAIMTVDDFLCLSPKIYKELTEKKLCLTQKSSLKLAQKKVSKALKNNESIDSAT